MKKIILCVAIAITLAACTKPNQQLECPPIPVFVKIEAVYADSSIISTPIILVK